MQKPAPEMTAMIPMPIGYRFAAAIVIACLTAMAGGAEPPGGKFEGQWSLELQISTKPGGETLEGAGAVTSPIHIQITAANPSFTVSEEGKFSWDSRDFGSSQVTKHAAYTGGGTSDTSEQTRVLLKAQGSVSDQRVLTIDPQWTIGNGQIWTFGSRGVIYIGTYTLSGDGSTLSVSTSGNVPGAWGTHTLPVTYDGKPWTLAPASIEQQEIVPEVVREIVTYRAQRQGTYGGAVPVTERIEIKQVRYLKLIPRG